MRLFLTSSAIALCLLNSPAATAGTVDHFHSDRPDSHAPISIMGDHMHKPGEVMLSYRYMNMAMEGNKDGSNRVTDQSVLDSGYAVVPTKMSDEMHMFGVMYGISDRVTLSVMMPWLEKRMDHRTAMGTTFTTRTAGIGDFSVSTLIKLGDWNDGRSHLILSTGISLPTGSIDKKDDTPAMADARLPYPMQLGSGTYDLLLGITAAGQEDEWSWGRQVKGTVRFGTNDEGYTLGDRVSAAFWAARQMSDVHSLSVRLQGEVWRNIDGEDDLLNPAMIPTADPGLRAGKRLDLAVGFNYLGKEGLLEDQRLAVEIAVPAYQSLSGPQLETDKVVTVGWQHLWD